MKQFSQALYDAQQAVRHAPQWAKARVRLGAALKGLGREAEALEAYAQAHRLEPDSQTYFQLLVSARKAAGLQSERSQTSASMPPSTPLEPLPRSSSIAFAAAALETAMQAAQEQQAALTESARRQYLQHRWRCVIAQVRRQVAEQRSSQCLAAMWPLLRELRFRANQLRSEIAGLREERNAMDACDEWKSASCNSDSGAGSDCSETTSNAASDDDSCDEWAAQWEAEQHEATTAKPGHAGPSAKEPVAGASRHPVLSTDALRSLFFNSSASSSGGMQRDASGAPRGACRSEECACQAFLPFTLGQPLPTIMPLATQLLMLSSAPKTRCLTCGCFATSHETVQQSAAWQRLSADRTRRIEEQSRAAATERHRRVQAAVQRASESASAIDSADILQRSKCDTITGAERCACTQCSTCPGFEVWYRQRDASSPQVMFYCSRCGCEAGVHSISASWSAAQQREERRRAAEVEARRRAYSHWSDVSDAARCDAHAAARHKHLAVLGLTPTATNAQASTAYRKLALRYHPDKNACRSDKAKARAAAQWLAVSAAWRGLCGQP